jgi:hypothetical protein
MFCREDHLLKSKIFRAVSLAVITVLTHGYKWCTSHVIPLLSFPKPTFNDKYECVSCSIIKLLLVSREVEVEIGAIEYRPL